MSYYGVCNLVCLNTGQKIYENVAAMFEAGLKIFKNCLHLSYRDSFQNIILVPFLKRTHFSTFFQFPVPIVISWQFFSYVKRLI